MSAGGSAAARGRSGAGAERGARRDPGPGPGGLCWALGYLKEREESKGKVMQSFKHGWECCVHDAISCNCQSWIE